MRSFALIPLFLAAVVSADDGKWSFLETDDKTCKNLDERRGWNQKAGGWGCTNFPHKDYESDAYFGFRGDNYKITLYTGEKCKDELKVDSTKCIGSGDLKKLGSFKVC